MKRNYLLTLLCFTLFSIGMQSLQSNPTGAPSDGRTGSPGDGGKTCYASGCHFGAPTAITGVISTNVPAAGYVPGTTYTVTVSIPFSNKKGFCVSPQKTDGTLMGSLIAGSGNQVTNSKYVTHTNYKTTNPGVWTFQWVAPAKGAGIVDFYGAFAVTQSTTYTQKIAVQEAIPAGLSANATFNLTNLYPNPISGQELNIGFELKMAAQVKLSLIDITGGEAVMLKSEMMSAGIHQNTYDLPQLSKGIYFLRIETNNDVLTKKVLVQ